jgi:hypothetical protein
MTSLAIKTVALSGVMCALSPSLLSTQASSSPACTVTITSPKTGEKHGPDVLVKGAAAVPAGRHLWVFAHRKGVAIWWPQGGGAATVERGEYSVLASLGGPQDLGADFEILAQVLEGSDDATLNAWFKVAEQTGKYPGMRLPPAADGCGTPPKVTVTKDK